MHVAFSFHGPKIHPTIHVRQHVVIAGSLNIIELNDP